jgi:hypothetical protein
VGAVPRSFTPPAEETQEGAVVGETSKGHDEEGVDGVQMEVVERGRRVRRRRLEIIAD